MEKKSRENSKWMKKSNENNNQILLDLKIKRYFNNM